MQVKEFTLVEAPIYQGQRHFGTALGPAFLKQNLLDQNFHFISRAVSAKQSRRQLNTEAYRELAKICKEEYLKENLLFIVGGDHSLAYGSIQGLLACKPDLKVLWIDAHGDINTRESSLTGAFHGMPLAFLMGADEFGQGFQKKNYLKPENLIYFGVRDLDAAEKSFLVENKIKHYSAADIQEKGLYEVIREIEEMVEGSDLHISVDSDAFDPAIAPSTGVPVAHGLNEKQVYELVQRVCEIASVKSFEYVELNPQIFVQPEDVFKTAQIGINLFNEVLNQFNKKEKVYGRYDDRKRDAAVSEILF
ncbi:MAG: arginase family protein [Pseudobdellovibrio sp.]